MLKQTVLKFQGALGLLGFGFKGDDEDSDSGNSATQGSWEDDNNDDKEDSYLSTGVLIPTHQPVSEIIVTRHRVSGINSLLDAYKAMKRTSSSTTGSLTSKSSSPTMMLIQGS